MSRIPIIAQIEDAPSASRSLLEAVQRRIGRLPNFFRLIGNSPSVLQGHLSLFEALSKGALSLATRERIALAIAEMHGCDYCLSNHTYSGKNLVKFDDAEITANRSGRSNDLKADAAVRFAVMVAQNRGQVSPADIEVVRGAGYGDAELLEIIQHVALNTWSNYVNIAFDTEIDFPRITHRPRT